MRSIRAKLKRPGSGSSNGNKDEWSKLDQRIWHSVAANQPVKLAVKFSKHPNINVNKLCPSVGYSVVHYAAAKGLDDCLNVLLAHNANNSTRDVTGATPLHASARYGHKGTTSKLLATCTVDVNARDDNQCTALHFAAFEGHLNCTKLIASNADCDIHCVDKDGRTALMVAAAMGRLSVCHELIERGVNVNHIDSSSLHNTALTLAAEAGHADVVKLLCECGANYNYKLSDDRTALDVARGRSRRSVVDALHVIQLTEAAKKTDRGTRLSSTSSSSKLYAEKPEEKAKTGHQEVKTVASEPIGQVPQELSQLQRKVSPLVSDRKVEDRVSPSEQQACATVLPLYNNSKHGNLYDRDVSLYDSKSTLASVSSLDVSNVLETSRNCFQNEQPPTPQLQLKDSNTKQTLKLAEELMLKEEQIAHMELRLHDIVSASTREIESLKNSNTKYERSVQELERANDLLSQDCMKLQLEKKETLRDIELLQKSIKDMDALRENYKIAQEKKTESEAGVKGLTLKIEQLTVEKHEMIAYYEQERDTLQSVQSGLSQLLSDVGLENNNQDYDESLRLLKCEVERLKEKNEKEIELEEIRKHELEQLTRKIIEQDKLIQAMKLKLVESEKTIERVQQDRDYLLEDRNSLEIQLQDAADVTSKHAGITSLLQDDVSRLKEQLALEELNHWEKQQLEDRLQTSLSVNEQTAKNYEMDKSLWKQTEATLMEKIENLMLKYNEAKKEAVDNEKTINQLRAERNHRKAVVSKMEKDVESMENRRKEVEVESNRTRQQLTESKQKCSKLEEEIIVLQRAKKELASKLNSIKLYECTKLERKKIDSMKMQLENLCKHIQESEIKYNETISAYRGHLLMAAKGELNPDVLAPLREILKLQEEPQSHDQF